MSNHLQSAHDIHIPQDQPLIPPPEVGIRKHYKIIIPPESKADSKTLYCPIPSCPAHSKPQVLHHLTQHIAICHPSTRLTIANRPYRQCPYCTKYICYLNFTKHITSKTCKRLTNLRHQRQQLFLQQQQSHTKFYINNIPLQQVSSFKYLGRVLTSNDTDNAAIQARIQEATKVWRNYSKTLLSPDIDIQDYKTIARFYLTIAQAKLLHGSETWILSPSCLRLLQTFHKKCARQIAHQPIRHNPDGTWTHPNTDQLFENCGLQPIENYINKRQQRLLNSYAEIHSPIYQLCQQMKPTRTRRTTWWQQVDKKIN
jgi:hypothetical protein